MSSTPRYEEDELEGLVAIRRQVMRSHDQGHIPPADQWRVNDRLESLDTVIGALARDRFDALEGPLRRQLRVARVVAVAYLLTFPLFVFLGGSLIELFVVWPIPLLFWVWIHGPAARELRDLRVARARDRLCEL